MTEQYNQRNINNQGNAITFTNSVGTPNIALQPASQIAMLDSTLSVMTVTLPDAADAGQNAEVTLVTVAAGLLITVAASAGDTIVASPAVLLATLGIVIGATVTYRSDGVSRWVAVTFVP